MRRGQAVAEALHRAVHLVSGLVVGLHRRRVLAPRERAQHEPDLAQAAAQQARHRRHHRVRRDGGEHHEVDLARFEAPLGEAAFDPAQCLARRLLGQVGVRLSYGHVPALDAGARPDPLVVRVDERLQVVVLHLKRRSRLAESHQCTAHDVSPAFDQDAPAPPTANGLPRKSRQYFDNQTNCLL